MRDPALEPSRVFAQWTEFSGSSVFVLDFEKLPFADQAQDWSLQQLVISPLQPTELAMHPSEANRPKLGPQESVSTGILRTVLVIFAFAVFVAIKLVLAKVHRAHSKEEPLVEALGTSSVLGTGS